MSPRPRRPDRNGLPTGVRVHLKGGNTYYTWVHPVTRAEKSLQATNDRALAIRRAQAANAIVAQQINDDVIQQVSNRTSRAKLFSAWCTEYLRIIKSPSRKLRPNTIRSRESMVRAWGRAIGRKPIEEIVVKDIADVLNALRKAGKERSAQAMRSVAIDMFRDARAEGWCSQDNPAAITRAPSVSVKRSRLLLEEFQTIIGHAAYPWERNAMLLALLTAQGREDLALASFRRFADWEKRWRAYPTTGVMPYSFVEDGHFCATRQKTGALIKIPLGLRLEAAGMSVEDVVTMCRDDVRSHFLIHHTVPRTYAAVGDPVHKDTISRAFARARDKSGLTWAKAPPTFHEIRSLSERLYREQGVDTQRLLGHRQASTTDAYNDIRGADWVEIKADRYGTETVK